jgi:hypothetical protein
MQHTDDDLPAGTRQQQTFDVRHMWSLPKAWVCSGCVHVLCETLPRGQHMAGRPNGKGSSMSHACH